MGRETVGEDGEPGTDGEAMGSLAGRTVDAAKWRIALVATNVPVQFAIGVLLARLLPPADFGLIGLAMIVVGLVDLVVRETLNPAVVQRKELSDRHVRVAFTLSVLMGVGISASVAVAAPAAGLLFDNARVPAILRVVALIFFVNGFGNIGSALLWRELDFRRVYFIVVSSYVLGYAVPAAALALGGFGVWSLVAGTLGRYVVEVVLVLTFVDHPRWPLLAKRETRELMRMGFGFSLRAVADYLARRGDQFVVGRWLGSHALGLYTRAFGIVNLPAERLQAVVHKVLFPAMSRAQDEPARLRRAYVMSTQLIALVVAPIMAGLAVAAPHLIVGLYGESWAGAVVPLQALCVAGFFQALYPLDRLAAEAAGHVYAVVPRVAVHAVLILGGGYLASRFGTAAVAAAVSLAAVAMYLLLRQITIRHLEVQGRDVLSAVSGGLTLAAGVGVSAAVTRAALEAGGVGHLPILVAIMAACAATYLAGIYFLPERVRPVALFEKICAPSSRLPDGVLRWARRFLRVGRPARMGEAGG